jgi:hypothetical protein
VVVRALIYLQSDDTYKVVFPTSHVEKAFATYDFGLLDFHPRTPLGRRAYTIPPTRQRILLKCNYLSHAAAARLLGHVALANTGRVLRREGGDVEYSKSPRTPPAGRGVGLLCNLIRLAETTFHR